MTGNTPIVPQILGASTVAGAAAVALPVTGSNQLVTIILTAVIAVAVAVVISRLVKVIVTKRS